jgi:acyl carrier protein
MDRRAFYDLIAESLGIPASELNEASDMENTENWDSLRQIMLMTEFGRVLGIELTPEEMMEGSSIARIKAILSGRGVVVA